MQEPPDPGSQARIERRRAAHRRVVRQRRIAAAAAILVAGGSVVAGILVADGSSAPEATAQNARHHTTTVEIESLPKLPRGGRRLFPRYRIVAYYGTPGNEELGALGIGTPAQAGRRLLAQMAPYRRGGRHLLPALELIVVVAAGSAGEDDSYTHRTPSAVVREYLAEARKLKALLVLDFQPGHADFPRLVREYARFLREPDVGVALDPEWHTPGAVPGTVIGSTDAATVNRVSAYLAQIVERYRLPQKLLVVHEFTDSMVRNKSRLRRRRGIALVMNVDGFGDPPNKIAKYRDLTHASTRFRRGFKVFYKEDTNMMSPQQVLALRPRPDVVIYE